MRIIPVLDVRRGQAVHAIAGDRAHYGPLRSVLHPGTDPATLARMALEAWSLPDLYLADLDAILVEASTDLRLCRAIADLGLTLWVDAGVRDRRDAAALVESGVGRVVVGLETIRGPESLAGVVAEVGPGAVAFSLDLRGGRPILDTLPDWGTDRPLEIAGLAIRAGVRRLIHLDLARVGTGEGVATFEGLSKHPEVEWIVGGGVSGMDEIRTLERLGWQGVLVGSAMHDGRITRADLASVQRPSDQLTIRDWPSSSSM